MTPALPTPLRAAVVGCGGMARWHMRALADLDEYEFIAVCDLDPSAADQAARELDVPATHTDYSRLLADERPEVVVIVTPCSLHAEMTIQASEAGARGVYCEKPLATCLADGEAMVAACRERGTALAVNHQRRLSSPILRMRALIADGAIGDAHLFRGGCAGDLLSDGTHLVDTIRFLAGDAEVRWVFGQVHREPCDDPPRKPGGVQLRFGGFRYGHPVETGAFAVWEFDTGARAEILCGDLRLADRAYGDYEVWGTKGRLWRAGDVADPALLIQDESGGWRPVEAIEPSEPHAISSAAARESYRLFAATIDAGADHPLSGDSALKDLEIIMAIFESARLRSKIALPLDQPRFPLEIMIDSGDL
jgi:UDP-N-acetyl-2-amino-2-deoxyglucuronate dehydrogenase